MLIYGANIFLLFGVLSFSQLNNVHEAKAGPAPASQNSAKLSTFSINIRKPVHVVSERFISFTVDPNMLLHTAECEMSPATINMAKGLTPAYFRVAGPDSNKYVFRLSADSSLQEQLDSRNNQTVNLNSKNVTITGLQWIALNNFIKETGFDMIVALNGGVQKGHSSWNLSSALELITFSDKYGYNIGWQLGYEMQRVANDRGKDMGRDVARLRKVLEAFPRYYNSPIIGPDMISFETREDVIFTRNYLSEADDALNVFTWHPHLSALKEEEDPSNVLSHSLTQLDNYVWIREGLLKSISKGIVPKKPIWIGESETKSPEGSFTDAMSYLRKLGTTAKLGISVYMRKPHQLSLFEPTAEYWIALFHKSLVGKTVLDIHPINGNNTRLHLFTHCTQILEHPEDGVINPSLGYERGGITIFGVNFSPEKARISLKVGLKVEETVHQYILTETQHGDDKKILLNGQELRLSKDNELPMISPRVKTAPKFVTIPARSAFFYVLPETKCKVCVMQSSEDPLDSARMRNRLNTIIEDEPETDTTDIHTSNMQDTMEDEMDFDEEYVSFPKRFQTPRSRKEIPHTHKTTPQPNIHYESRHRKGDDIGKHQEESVKMHEDMELAPVVKYVTFSDDTWLSSFPSKLNDGEYSDKKLDDSLEPSKMIHSGDYIMERKETPSSRIEKYRVFTQAILGKRNVTNTNTVGDFVKSTEMPYRSMGDSAELKVKRSNRFKKSVDYDSEPRSYANRQRIRKIDENEIGNQREMNRYNKNPKGSFLVVPMDDLFEEERDYYDNGDDFISGEDSSYGKVQYYASKSKDPSCAFSKERKLSDEKLKSVDMLSKMIFIIPQSKLPENDGDVYDDIVLLRQNYGTSQPERSGMKNSEQIATETLNKFEQFDKNSDEVEKLLMGSSEHEPLHNTIKEITVTERNTFLDSKISTTGGNNSIETIVVDNEGENEITDNNMVGEMKNEVRQKREFTIWPVIELRDQNMSIYEKLEVAKDESDMPNGTHEAKLKPSGEIGVANYLSNENLTNVKCTEPINVTDSPQSAQNIESTNLQSTTESTPLLAKTDSLGSTKSVEIKQSNSHLETDYSISGKGATDEQLLALEDSHIQRGSRDTAQQSISELETTEDKMKKERKELIKHLQSTKEKQLDTTEKEDRPLIVSPFSKRRSEKNVKKLQEQPIAKGNLDNVEMNVPSQPNIVEKLEAIHLEKPIGEKLLENIQREQDSAAENLKFQERREKMMDNLKQKIEKMRKTEEKQPETPKPNSIQLPEKYQARMKELQERYRNRLEELKKKYADKTQKQSFMKENQRRKRQTIETKSIDPTPMARKTKLDDKLQEIKKKTHDRRQLRKEESKRKEDKKKESKQEDKHQPKVRKPRSIGEDKHNLPNVLNSVLEKHQTLMKNLQDKIDQLQQKINQKRSSRTSSKKSENTEHHHKHKREIDDKNEIEDMYKFVDNIIDTYPKKMDFLKYKRDPFPILDTNLLELGMKSNIFEKPLIEQTNSLKGVVNNVKNMIEDSEKIDDVLRLQNKINDDLHLIQNTIRMERSASASDDIVSLVDDKLNEIESGEDFETTSMSKIIKSKEMMRGNLNIDKDPNDLMFHKNNEVQSSLHLLDNEIGNAFESDLTEPSTKNKNDLNLLTETATTTEPSHIKKEQENKETNVFKPKTVKSNVFAVISADDFWSNIWARISSFWSYFYNLTGW